MIKLRRLFGLVLLLVIPAITLFYLRRPRDYSYPISVPLTSNGQQDVDTQSPTSGSHPIHRLAINAEKDFLALRARQSGTLAEAVTEYRRRYGLPPPPNFDKWYEFARQKNVQLIDEYDSIYHSLLPFWALPPVVIRERTREAIGFNNALIAVLIRDGKVTKMEGGGEMYQWHREATPVMLKHFIKHLPDMDLAFNVHDEPRIVMQHDELARHVEIAKSQSIPRVNANADSNPTQLKNHFSPRPADMNDGHRIKEYKTTRFNVFAHQPTWSNSRISCSPDSAARRCLNDSCLDDTAIYASIDGKELPLGFIANVTAFSDICNSPSMERSFGFFDRPNAFDVAHELFPIFSQSKVSSFQDILYPSPWYYMGRVRYQSRKDMPWEEKRGNLYWRGSTTGGFSRDGGWRRQHRQRFLQKIMPGGTTSLPKILEYDNSTSAIDETRTSTLDGVDGSPAATFGETGRPKLEPVSGSGSGSGTGTGMWREKPVDMASLSHFFDVRFTFIGQCDPGDCDAQREYFGIVEPVDMFDAFGSKYLLDIDGNAFSGRYYAWLTSHSLVYKLAVFREWHDEWLRPWVHYVPLGLQGEEYVESIRYFEEEENQKEEKEEVVAGGTDKPGLGKRMAEQGRDWAQKVLRNDDLEVYYFRLLLEYGRLIDDDREAIGFVMPAST